MENHNSEGKSDHEAEGTVRDTGDHQPDSIISGTAEFSVCDQDDLSINWTTTIDDSEESIASSSDYDGSDEGDEKSQSNEDDSAGSSMVVERSGDKSKQVVDQRHSTSHEGTSSRKLHTISKHDGHSGNEVQNSNSGTADISRSTSEREISTGTSRSQQPFAESDDKSDKDQFESVKELGFLSSYADQDVLNFDSKIIVDDSDQCNSNFEDTNCGFPSHFNRFCYLENDYSGQSSNHSCSSANDEEENVENQEENVENQEENVENQEENVENVVNQENEEAPSRSKTSHTQSSLRDSDTLFDLYLLSDNESHSERSRSDRVGRRSIQGKQSKKPAKAFYKISNTRRGPFGRRYPFAPKYGTWWSEMQRNVNVFSSASRKPASAHSKCATDYSHQSEQVGPIIFKSEFWKNSMPPR